LTPSEGKAPAEPRIPNDFPHKREGEAGEAPAESRFSNGIPLVKLFSNLDPRWV